MKLLVGRRIARALRKPWRDQLRSSLRGLHWLLAPWLTCMVWQLRPWRRSVAHSLQQRVVITLTSYPGRYASLDLTLKCLLLQSVRADAVMLWLHEPDIARLPRSVLRLQGHGLEIRSWPEDLRSYKKLVPLLALEPQVVAVTADDDACYPRRWLAELLAGHAAHPQAVLCHRAHVVGFDAAGQPLPYRRWAKASEARGPQEALFFTGIGGVLFPPGALPAETTDAARFRTLCPDADDVWLNAMVRRGGATILRVGSNAHFSTWPSSQRRSLFHLNARGSGNDEAIARVMAAYGADLFGSPAQTMPARAKPAATWPEPLGGKLGAVP